MLCQAYRHPYSCTRIPGTPSQQCLVSDHHVITARGWLQAAQHRLKPILLKVFGKQMAQDLRMLKL